MWKNFTFFGLGGWEHIFLFSNFEIFYNKKKQIYVHKLLFIHLFMYSFIYIFIHFFHSIQFHTLCQTWCQEEMMDKRYAFSSRQFSLGDSYHRYIVSSHWSPEGIFEAWILVEVI